MISYFISCPQPAKMIYFSQMKRSSRPVINRTPGEAGKKPALCLSNREICLMQIESGHPSFYIQFVF